MLSNIFWLGTKEIRSLMRDVLMIVLIVWALGPSIIERARGFKEPVNNASVAIVDEDHSALSRKLRNAITPPYFQTPKIISAAEIDRGMDESLYTFVIVIPPRFEADIAKGLEPELQLNIDATAVMQAATGASYLYAILLQEIANFAQRSDAASISMIDLVSRRAFNPNGEQIWFQSVVALLDQLSILTIALVGAALLREREHGTIEHLLVMPLTAFEIAMAKVLANGLVILIAFAISMAVVVEYILGVPIAGSRALLLLGTTIYLFSAAAIGIFLGTVARTMAQFSLLLLMTVMPMMMLSGGVTPIESQPEWLQPLTLLLPSRHYMAYAQAIIFRGAGFETVWPQFLAVVILGSAFLGTSLLLFRRSIAASR
ncbi:MULTISPECIES: ABC transporter permease [Filomicrobium]|nr:MULTISPECIES: ABC transporter permease [Filomicrobium]